MQFMINPRVSSVGPILLCEKGIDRETKRKTDAENLWYFASA
ncbi:hypothetical protein HNQ53_002844 [Microbulbifer hydrolyticus]|uniref:Uncharacterized protein n=1 Tax=Microbulbifer hydrolyticus TaxID=48074 RepID=A0AA89T5I2_9GAMM|nr:hypothetical protein [Microbulbifer hydrolyticus]